MKKVSVCVAFTPEEMKKGDNFIRLIQILIDTDHEIKVSSDGYCTIVEANYKELNSQSGFDWVEEDEIVVPADAVDFEAYENYKQERGEK